jgi:hypothetical protein
MIKYNLTLHKNLNIVIPFYSLESEDKYNGWNNKTHEYVINKKDKYNIYSKIVLKNTLDMPNYFVINYYIKKNNEIIPIINSHQIQNKRYITLNNNISIDFNKNDKISFWISTESEHLEISGVDTIIKLFRHKV